MTCLETGKINSVDSDTKSWEAFEIFEQKSFCELNVNKPSQVRNLYLDFE